MLLPIFVIAVLASAQGRAVNISNTWVLPEEGFPVFYRYFRDRISWYEADAVCQFHHANLVTVDTTAQYDAVRAYLKELDISSAVWVGLIRSNSDGDFTWTDYRGLSSDGYWSAAPDPKAAPLCAAADPSADYRWEARACGGPTVASFICELPVPQWALGNEGCMVRAIPALTVLYLPESAAVQLTADCGLAEVKRVQCTGHVKREDLLKNLSCNEDEELTTVINTSSSTYWSITSDRSFTDEETTEFTTQESTQNTIINESIKTKPQNNSGTENKNQVTLDNSNNFNRKTVNNNLQSNVIPKFANNNNFLSNEESEKLEDERHMQHKMLHEELARLGNFETIFSQPADHFVPPLVMARAKISDDMTVLSVEEKHAQHIADEKHNIQQQKLINKTQISNSSVESTTSESLTTNNAFTKSDTFLSEKYTNKKDKMKPPKKYIEKFDNPKAKLLKPLEVKEMKYEKLPISITTEQYHDSTVSKSILMESVKNINESLNSTTKTSSYLDDSEDDTAIDLTVIIKEPGNESEQKVFYSNYTGDISKIELIKNETSYYLEPKVVIGYSEYPLSQHQNTSVDPHKDGNGTIHEIIKIEIIDENIHESYSPTVIEVTTLTPVFKDENSTELETKTIIKGTEELTEKLSTSAKLTSSTTEIPLENDTSILNVTQTDVNISSQKPTTLLPSLDTLISTTKTILTTLLYDKITKEIELRINATNTPNLSFIDVSSDYNKTVINNDGVFNETATEMNDDDFHSPLLSAANEPAYRPNRSRRLQQTPRKSKFNPFRILG